MTDTTPTIYETIYNVEKAGELGSTYVVDPTHNVAYYTGASIVSDTVEWDGEPYTPGKKCDYPGGNDKLAYIHEFATNEFFDNADQIKWHLEDLVTDALETGKPFRIQIVAIEGEGYSEGLDPEPVGWALIARLGVTNVDA